ncbi:tRNA (guanine10-N2)-methyltransferase [Candida albicans SC5314]|uniref:tRNA (guanine(10)-N(2))-methyltransferase n=2 Tax=Candida albicans TaxID=5476 RepID=Q5ANB6_CANAL|nr:tRNA (guanine-N2-)-methyltransferase [Candida albicans SC5314]AOW28529.1 tRNA (guanine-N2-)-methyltransferase [Candida albicans SC5314]KGT69945.1 tRNA (guanine10-N2)-methyltransferase [Candida albicans 12C]KHC79056.1 tRNA (guanine10-N2)-methyltransferase [Candida albicans SC5314]KHC87280.1 tRNA (guanine10-N2)-methyltransferase [Candida albicans SC5314]|eukprot:XP_723198.1 tRNA (guanine-N2-)-methyltransferase [Candida albicans SC5314]
MVKSNSELLFFDLATQKNLYEKIYHAMDSSLANPIMKDYLIHLASTFPKFRIAELEALADLYNIDVDLSSHNEDSTFLVVSLENDEQARQLISRSVMSFGIYELWGYGETYDKLHEDVRAKSADKFEKYKDVSFKFDFKNFRGRPSNKGKVRIIESFSYLPFEGKIDLKNPDEIFTVVEEYKYNDRAKSESPIHIWFTRQLQLSERSNGLVETYDLKKRNYIGTTSFEAELSLVTCNLAQIAPGKITYDPFTGTGSFLVAAAHFGGYPIGSDIDVRMLNGRGNDKNVKSNFKQYGTSGNFIDVLTMDFTHNALRKDFQIDSIVCDPPYGVREGLRVLGAKNEEKAAGREHDVFDGEIAYLRREFIPPKKPYSLANLLEDLLQFASERLPVGGRLAFWMPTANDNFEETQIPQHERLELLHCLEQSFNQWSRRLLVYVKRDESYKGITSNGLKEKNIRDFRVRYFKRFIDKNE